MQRKTAHPIEHEKPDTHSQSVQSALTPPGGNATARTVLDAKGTEIYSIRPADSIHKASEELKEHNIGALLVRDQNGTVVGIITERDIVRGFADEPSDTYSRRVEELMTTEVIACAPDERLLEMLHRMTDGRFRHLPVMENGHVLGMISIGDVVKFRLRELEYEALKMRQMIVG